MSNEQKTPRILVEDLPVAEEELTEKDMGKVQGGGALNLSKDNIKHGDPAPAKKPGLSA